MLFLLSACATTEDVEAPPTVNPSPERFSAEGRKEEPSTGSLGLEVEAHESDSLERLEILPGVRVSRVVPGGPADLGGILPGDVVLSVDGVPANERDGFEALARKANQGQILDLEVRRDTVVFKAQVVAGARPAATEAIELYRVDPVKLRAGFRTVASGEGASLRIAAEVVRLFPRSPLEVSGICPGDRIVGLSGRDVASAQDLVRRVLEEHEYGERVQLTLLRDGKEAVLPVRLWSPERRLTRLAIPILFNYEWKLKPRRTRWALIDLWIISLFEFRREEGEREFRFLSLFKFRKGHGELVEEPRKEGS